MKLSTFGAQAAGFRLTATHKYYSPVKAGNDPVTSKRKQQDIAERLEKAAELRKKRYVSGRILKAIL